MPKLEHILQAMKDIDREYHSVFHKSAFKLEQVLIVVHSKTDIIHHSIKSALYEILNLVDICFLRAYLIDRLDYGVDTPFKLEHL